MTTRILLVRHGQSTWNADGRWQGRADPPLSALGELQAANASTSEHVDGITQIWSSGLVRASRSAQIVGDALDLDVQIDDRLMERDAGEWTGLTRTQIDEGWPGFLGSQGRPSGFEGDDEVVKRALAVLEAIEGGASGESVLAFTHGGLIRAVERHLGVDSPAVPNLGGTVVLARSGNFEHVSRVLLIDPESVELTTPQQI